MTFNEEAENLSLYQNVSDIRLIMDQAANLRKLSEARFQAKTSVLESPKESSEGFHTISNPLHSRQQCKTICITSGKGGVGKTTLSVNLAISMAKAGKKVLLFDADLGLANVNVLLGIIPEYNIYDVLKGKKQIKDIIISSSFGIDIIAGANGISQLANMSEVQRDLFINGLGEISGYDVMVIDTGAGVGANVISFVLPADEIVVVTNPEPTAITDAYGMIKSIVANYKDKSIKLAINRVPSAGEAKRVSDRLINISAQFLKTNVENIGFVFADHLVQKSICSQRPHVILYPGSKSAACINHMAARLLNSSVEESGSGVLGFFKRMLLLNTQEEGISSQAI